MLCGVLDGEQCVVGAVWQTSTSWSTLLESLQWVTHATGLQVHRMRDLNPLAFFRAPFAGQRAPEADKAAEALPAGSKAIPKVPSLLFELEVSQASSMLPQALGYPDLT